MRINNLLRTSCGDCSYARNFLRRTRSSKTLHMLPEDETDTSERLAIMPVNYLVDTLAATGYYDIEVQPFTVPSSSVDLSVNGVTYEAAPMTFTAAGAPSGPLILVANVGCDAVSLLCTLPHEASNSECFPGGLPSRTHWQACSHQSWDLHVRY
jgi:hypothetical protein